MRVNFKAIFEEIFKIIVGDIENQPINQPDMTLLHSFQTTVSLLLLAHWSQLIHLFWLCGDFLKRWWGKKSGFYVNKASMKQ